MTATETTGKIAQFLLDTSTMTDADFSPDVVLEYLAPLQLQEWAGEGHCVIPIQIFRPEIGVYC